MKMEGKQTPPQMQLDIMKDTTIIRCDNKIVDTEKGVEYTCNGEAFDQAIELRKISALVSPTGKAGVVPVPYYYCMKCGMRMNLEKVQ